MNATIVSSLRRPERAEVSSGPLDQELKFLGREHARSGSAYDFYVGRISGNPVIRSEATGKYCMLPWSRLIDIAVEHGLDRQ